CRDRRLNELWAEHCGCVSAERHICGPRPQRGAASDPAGRTTDQIRASRQPQHRQGVGPHRARQAARARRRGDRVRRREFITLLGGVAAWPLAARAEQPERMRRIGVLLPATPGDAEYQALVEVLLQELALLGWSIGRNARIDTRWAGAHAVELRRH